MDTRDAISPAERAALEALYQETADDPDATAGASELLASWKPVRAAVAMARDAGFDEEPPARLDALLLAAARQAAPVPRPGWAARLSAWLLPVIAHPALAGAAALVVVGGAAGVLYLRGQGQMVQPRVGRTGATTSGSGAGTATTTTTTTTTVESGALTPMMESARPPAGEVAVPDLPGEPSGDRPGPSPRLRPRSSTGSSAGRDVNLPVVRGSVPAVGGSGDLEESRGKVEVREPATEDRPDPASPDDRAAPVPEVTGTAGVADTDSSGGADSRQQTLAQVEQLTRQARTAAGNGDCGAVKVISARVKTLAAAYHRDTFLTDPAIARCLR